VTHYKRRKPRDHVRCVLCTPRGNPKDTEDRRKREVAKANADVTEDEIPQCTCQPGSEQCLSCPEGPSDD
jgi:hypothetical protein